MKVVTLETPRQSDAIADKCDEMGRRVRGGEFEEILFMAVRPDGSWMTGGAGNSDPIRLVGLLQSAIHDTLKLHEK